MEQTNNTQIDTVRDDLLEVQELLAKHRLVGEMARRQDSPRKEVVNNLVQRQHVAELRHLLFRLPVLSMRQPQSGALRSALASISDQQSPRSWLAFGLARKA